MEGEIDVVDDPSLDGIVFLFPLEWINNKSRMMERTNIFYFGVCFSIPSQIIDNKSLRVPTKKVAGEKLT